MITFSISLVIRAFGVSSSRIFLTSDPNELCDSVKVILKWLKWKEVGISSDIIKEEITPIVDKLLESKCMSNKQHSQVPNFSF